MKSHVKEHSMEDRQTLALNGSSVESDGANQACDLERWFFAKKELAHSSAVKRAQHTPGTQEASRKHLSRSSL